MTRFLETITLAVAVAVLFAAAMFLGIVKPSRSADAGPLGWSLTPAARPLG
jgi:hypothetical protein